MIRIPTTQLDVVKTADSGQCFRFEAMAPGRYCVVNGDSYLEIEQPQGAEECVLRCSQAEYDAVWAPYFDMDHDYDAFIGAIDPADDFLIAAAQCGRGIRILRQGLWETLCAFLISQNNNIKRITRSVQGLCCEFGAAHEKGGVRYFEFPRPEWLLDEAALKTHGLGYRVPYVAGLAASVLSGQIDLDAIAASSDAEWAHSQLMAINGVGPKVCACVELFGLHNLRAYPVDTWIKKTLARRYPNGFDWSRYAGFEGVIQQYMFYYERSIA